MLSRFLPPFSSVFVCFSPFLSSSLFFISHVSIHPLLVSGLQDSLPFTALDCSECQEHESCPLYGEKKKPGNTLPRKAEICWATTNLLAGTAGTRVMLREQKQLFIKPPSWLLGAHFSSYQGATACSWKRFFHPKLRAWGSPSAHSDEQWEQGTACRVD